MPVTSKVEKITPSKAQQLLATNATNRKLRQSVVARYAADMSAGNWKIGGSTIDIDANGKLINGQHRLSAAVMAGTSFETVVLRGVDVSAQAVIDNGLKRSLGDLLAWRDETNVNALSATVVYSWRWVHTGLQHGTVGRPTMTEAIDYLDANPGLRPAINVTSHVRAQYKLPVGVVAAFYHQISMIDADEADQFFDLFNSGIGLEEDDPILVLRRWVFNHLNRRGAHQRPSADTYGAIMVKAWNAWITGRPVHSFTWRRGGSTKEAFPHLVDENGTVVLPHAEGLPPVLVVGEKLAA